MIARGTTPTIKYTFTEVNVTDITIAYLTVHQGSISIEHDLEDATVGDGYLEWTLSQEETLALSTKNFARIQCRYKTSDGNAYITEITEEKVYDILKEGEI